MNGPPLGRAATLNRIVNRLELDMTNTTGKISHGFEEHSKLHFAYVNEYSFGTLFASSKVSSEDALMKLAGIMADKLVAINKLTNSPA